jgi:hypothetical protein
MNGVVQTLMCTCTVLTLPEDGGYNDLRDKGTSARASCIGEAKEATPFCALHIRVLEVCRTLMSIAGMVCSEYVLFYRKGRIDAASGR